MKTAYIKINKSCFELQKEGFLSGETVKVQIDKEGRAWFGRCVVYKDNYELIQ